MKLTRALVCLVLMGCGPKPVCRDIWLPKEWMFDDAGTMYFQCPNPLQQPSTTPNNPIECKCVK